LRILESAQGWEEVLRHLKERGLETVVLFVSIDLAGLGDRIKSEFPDSLHQLCVVHKERNVLTKVRVRDKKQVLEGLKRVFDIQNPNRKGEEAKERLDEFIERWEKIYPGIGRHIEGKGVLIMIQTIPYFVLPDGFYCPKQVCIY
jgi:transposase-like protein